MADMAKHSEHYAAGAPYRRARASAWTVFWLTAGTSVLYNCYHALVDDRMPWYTGVPEGVLPLVVAIGVLEFSGAWRKNIPLQVAAWAVTGGAMAWSAVAINAVVRYGFALGLIGDTAALAAMYFLLNGPTAAQAVAKMDAKVAELLGRAGAEQSAREQAEAGGRAALSDLQAAADAELAKRDAAWRTELDDLRTASERTLNVERTARETAEAERDSIRSKADAEAARADRLERKLTGPARRSRTAPARSGTAPRTAAGTAPDDDLELESRALKLLATDLTMSGAELARQLEISPGYGRKLRRRLTGELPSEAEPDRPGDRSSTAPGDRPEDRT
jgi:hypothetical protein